MKRAKYYTDEYCPECEREVRIPARIRPMPKCPKCKHVLVPCSACDEETHKQCATCTSGDCKFKLHPGFKVKKTGFTLKALMKIVDKAYPSDEPVVLNSFIYGEGQGDTLALFIAREVKDTFDPWATKDMQLAEAARVIGLARDQLTNTEEDICTKLQEVLCQQKRKTRKIQKRRKGVAVASPLGF